MSKEEKTKRQDRVVKRDDRSSWRQHEQDDAKAEHDVRARRGDQEAKVETKDGTGVCGITGRAVEPVALVHGPAGVNVVDAVKEVDAASAT